MKVCLLLLLLALPLCAQPMNGTSFIDMGGDVISKYVYVKLPGSFNAAPVLEYTIQYAWSITRAPNGDKVFTFSAKDCAYYSAVNVLGNYIWSALPIPNCYPISQSAAETLGPVAAALTEFYNYHPKAPHRPPVYVTSVESAHPQLTTVQPITQPDPQMIFLDAIQDNAIKLDLTTDAIVSQVAVPLALGPLGVQPVATGPQNEIWIANGGLQVTVVDLAAQTVLANISTPSVPPAAGPAGIVFSNDGTTAFEGLSFSAPDSSGNNGALLVFDAVNRKVTSTFPLKYAPTALLMAPDGATAYLLSAGGQLTYYDVLSGTADLSVSTYTPGFQGGYPGTSAQVFVHPDGTRLFWNLGYFVVSFDLTSRKITAVVNTGLPSNSGSSMQMSQDGSTIWLANAAGTVAAYDVRAGVLLGTFTTAPNSQMYPGPVN